MTSTDRVLDNDFHRSAASGQDAETASFAVRAEEIQTQPKADDYPFIPESDQNQGNQVILQPTSKSFSTISVEKSKENDADKETDLAGFRIRRIMRWVGYGLFILYCVDVGYILYPPEFTNIVWEYQAMGDLVRLVPTLAISFILIFYGETADRKKKLNAGYYSYCLGLPY